MEQKINAEKVWKLLFDLLADQEGVDITYTLEKRGGTDEETADNKPTVIRGSTNKRHGNKAAS